MFPEGSEFLAKTSQFPYDIYLDKAEGSYVWDKNGKKYLDLVAGIAVANVGHRHPKVLQAIQEQSQKYLHTMVYGEYWQDAQIDLGQRLNSILPESLNCAYLVNSGTEANEAALKLAKRHTGRTKIISFRKSYHGSTHGSLSVSGNEEKKFAFRPLLPDVHFIDFNDPEGLSEIDNKTACVIVEPIQGDAGVRVGDHEFLKALRKRCDDYGAMLIFDEIQCGMGRTGKYFAFEHSGVIPDILTLAKSLGGGLPVGVMIAKREIMEDFTEKPMLGHITTFGGNPLSCVAASAVIDILKEEKLPEQAESKGGLFKELLKHNQIKELRQIGLMLAVDLESEEKLSRLLDLCKKDGVIIYRFLSHPYSFRISPPLNISEEDIRYGCEMILKNLDRI